MSRRGSGCPGLAVSPARQWVVAGGGDAAAAEAVAASVTVDSSCVGPTDPGDTIPPTRDRHDGGGDALLVVVLVVCVSATGGLHRW